jgi:predicted RNA-binding Zn-ribbon protein involved in translation (DUF1610 family)
LRWFKNRISTEEKEIYTLNGELSKIEKIYNTTLFEKMAGQEREKSIIEDGISADNIAQKYRDAKERVSQKEREIGELYRKFYLSEEVKEARDRVEKYRDEINSNYEFSSRYFHIKIYLVELLFTTPLVVIFYILMVRNRRLENFINYTIFKHLFIVAMIPLLSTIAELIYDYLPTQFIESLITFFYSIEIPFFLYYILIAIAVIVATLLIIYIQRFLKNRDKNGLTTVESYRKSECVSCVNRVDYKSMDFCPYCGNGLSEKCQFCGEKRLKGMNFCHHCGK